MKKFYEKSEIWFAVFWIVIYTVSMTALRNLGDDSPFMTAGLFVISALMLLFVVMNKLTAYYGLAGWAEKADYEHAFRMGLAAGSDSAFSEYLATKEEVRSVYDSIR